MQETRGLNNMEPPQGNSKWRIQDGGYFNIKDILIVTSSMLLMTTKLLLGTTNLSNMLLLRSCGYKSNLYENID